MSTACPAFRFDGRHAEATPVTVRIEGGQILVQAVADATRGTPADTPLGADSWGWSARHPLAEAQVSERFACAPRLVALPDGTTLEVPDPDSAFDGQLRDAGLRPGLVLRLQEYWPGALLCLGLVVGALVLAYVDGLPAAARWAAFALPAELEQRMGEQVLGAFDQHWLQPSTLPHEQRTAIAERFALAVAAAHPGLHYRLEFRTGLGVNAFALPGGHIVLLDDLVRLSGDDQDAVLGVLGHELGHVAGKHVTRHLLQSAGVGALSSLLWGDLSVVAGGLSTTLGLLAYSRDSEREADAFAVEFLAAQGLSPEPLDRFFRKLQEEHGRGADAIPAFLSSHPSTEERLERLRRHKP